MAPEKRPGSRVGRTSAGDGLPGQRVPAVTRAVNLLSALVEGPPVASLASLARRTGLPPSSALAVCSTLVDAGMMVRTADGRYRIGPRTLEFSRAYMAQTDLPREFDRICAELNVLPAETLVLGVLQGTDVVYIGRRIGSRPLAMSYQLGLRLPAHCTATGKALLAGLTTEEVATRYRLSADSPLPALTSHSILDVCSLIEELAAVRNAGYALDNEETAVGMTCVGAPVFDSTHQTVGAVAVSMVKAAMTDELREHVVQELKRLTTALSAALGAGR